MEMYKKANRSDCTPERLGPGYRELFRTTSVDPAKLPEIRRIADRCHKYQDVYERVGNKRRMAWQLVATLHNRECSGRFDQHLHNGDPLSKQTTHVPDNRPPGDGPWTWEESADDALGLKQPERIPVWDIPHTLWFLERWNGFGYRINDRHGGKIWSPFLWGWTNHHRVGKFTSDGPGGFSLTAPEKQAGAVPLLLALGWQPEE